MSVRFTDNSARVKEALNDAVVAYLHEAGGELHAQTVRNSSQGVKYKGKPAQNLWNYQVDESAKETAVGSPDEAGFWEEFGTGEKALYGNGRKGWWVYVEGQDSPRSNQKKYTEQEAKAVAASMRADGLDAHATNGRKPNRPLFSAYTSLKAALIRRAEDVIGGRLG